MVYGRVEKGKEAIALYPNRKRLTMFLDRVKKVFQGSQNVTAMELISKLNPMIRG